jgi:hypothetical protein
MRARVGVADLSFNGALDIRDQLRQPWRRHASYLVLDPNGELDAAAVRVLRDDSAAARERGATEIDTAELARDRCDAAAVAQPVGDELAERAVLCDGPSELPGCPRTDPSQG